MKVLLVFATDAEAAILKNIPYLITSGEGFKTRSVEIDVLVTGVGGMLTSWGMKKWLSSNSYPDLAINIGIAGSYNPEFKIGEVVVPVSDCFADAGIESPDRFITLAEAGFMNPNQFPFKNGFLEAENRYVEQAGKIMRKARAITVNSSTGTEQTIQKLKLKYNPDIETMEGATFFYICEVEKIPFLSLRAISNKVEPRNLKGWDIPLALKSLAEKLNEVLLMWD